MLSSFRQRSRSDFKVLIELAQVYIMATKAEEVGLRHTSRKRILRLLQIRIFENIRIYYKILGLFQKYVRKNVYVKCLSLVCKVLASINLSQIQYSILIHGINISLLSVA